MTNDYRKSRDAVVVHELSCHIMNQTWKKIYLKERKQTVLPLNVYLMNDAYLSRLKCYIPLTHTLRISSGNRNRWLVNETHTFIFYNAVHKTVRQPELDSLFPAGRLQIALHRNFRLPEPLRLRPLPDLTSCCVIYA